MQNSCKQTKNVDRLSEQQGRLRNFKGCSGETHSLVGNKSGETFLKEGFWNWSPSPVTRAVGHRAPPASLGRAAVGTGGAGWLGCMADQGKGWSPCPVLLKLPPGYCSSSNHTGINRAHQNMSNFEVRYWRSKLSCPTKLKNKFGYWPAKKKIKWLKSQMRKNEAGLFFTVTPLLLSVLQFFSLCVNPLAVTKTMW